MGRVDERFSAAINAQGVYNHFIQIPHIRIESNGKSDSGEGHGYLPGILADRRNKQRECYGRHTTTEISVSIGICTLVGALQQNTYAGHSCTLSVANLSPNLTVLDKRRGSKKGYPHIR